MKSLSQSGFRGAPRLRQRGVVLFFTLIALLAMSLAAVALIRSVDTNTLIAGNLATKQSTAMSGNVGVDTAMAWVSNIQFLNNTKNAYNDPTHPLNINDPVNGYYTAIVDPAANLTNGSVLKWNAADSASVNNGNADASGNTVRYVIHRMCRILNTDIKDAQCLYAPVGSDNSSQAVKDVSQICTGNCGQVGKSPRIRITVQIKDSKFTVTYLQAFVN